MTYTCGHSDCGCEVVAHLPLNNQCCLNCPLATCIHDMSAAGQDRDHETAQLRSLRPYMTVPELAILFRLSERTVARRLARTDTQRLTRSDTSAIVSVERATRSHSAQRVSAYIQGAIHVG